ncbi:c-type cytochrome [Humisphaera borealis]|uniref:Cytochrome c n=1 Tax=Humisphaera borealis TaxID=2807512 RepID=A0A7M2WZV2_9BACT|nr:cytochrome c [Humisphaera borealis]QOV91028.1 cytochrome c [Humisphaera borealis]
MNTHMTSFVRHLSVIAVGSVALLALASGCDKAVGATQDTPKPAVKVSLGSSDAADGQKWFNQACAACHGFNGQGMPRQGPTLRTSQFVFEHADDELVDFIKAGRAATDPKSLMKLQMPPKGTNPGLTDGQLKQIVAFIRQLQQEAGSGQTASAGL